MKLGELGEQIGSIAGLPVEDAGEAQVVGERLGALALPEDLGEGPGLDRAIEGLSRFQGDHAIQAGDCLAIGPQPGQAERPVVPGGGV